MSTDVANTHADWLKQIQPGDVVLVRNGKTIHFSAKVDRAIKTQIIIGSLKFRRSTGTLIRKARHPLPQRIFDGMRLVRSEGEVL